MPALIDSQKSILNTTNNLNAWSVENHRFSRGTVQVDTAAPRTCPPECQYVTYGMQTDKCPAPRREFEGVIDPCSGYVSAGGDVVRQTQVTQIETMEQKPINPATIIPVTARLREEFERSRSAKTTPQGMARGIDCLTNWTSKKVDPGYLRAQIAGFVRDEETKRRFPGAPPKVRLFDLIIRFI